MQHAAPVPADVKDVLYSAINEIGREKIRMEVSADIKASEKYCKEIIDKCVGRLGKADDATLGTLCEALLHFMLTASLLPSERKVSVRGSELDVVIPSTKALSKSPDRVLVIQVVRGDLADKIKHAEDIQPHPENVWLVSADKLQADRKNYHLGPGGLYWRIISDINAFLLEKGDRGLRMLHGQ
jgi:hypothetical protein